MVRQILGGVLLAARYPSPSDIPAGSYTSEAQRAAGTEEAESVSAKRRDLFTIFKNIVRINHELVIDTLRQQLQITLPNAQAPFQAGLGNHICLSLISCDDSNASEQRHLTFPDDKSGKNLS